MKALRYPVIVFLAGIAIWAWLRTRGNPVLEKPFPALVWEISESLEFPFGRHLLVVDPAQRRIRISREGETLYSTPASSSFLGASGGRQEMKEHRGSFSVRYKDVQPCEEQKVSRLIRERDAAVLEGSFLCSGRERAWSLRMEEKKGNLRLLVQVDPRLSRVYGRMDSDTDELFFGAGEQFTHFNLKGELVPVFVSEQGIGRGAEPLTFLVNLIAGSGGNSFTTYFASGLVLSTRNRGLFFDSSFYGELDFRKNSEIGFDYWSPNISFQILKENTPKELLTAATGLVGRMRPLPDWIHKGPVLGVQGGTERVRRILAEIDTPLAGVWLQDWVGQRKTSIGKQLWWNWDLNREHYPGWEKLKADLAGKGTRILGYINPFLAELPGEFPHKRRLRQEAAERGYLVKDQDGRTMDLLNTSFSASPLDLSSKRAGNWIKSVIVEQLIGNGFSGWMADFGEALPLDAVLETGEAREFHNLYPEEWARLNREAIDSTPAAKDLVFFSRSGFSRSPAYSTLFWTGDQMVTWDEYDGMKSSLTALLSSGLSGAAFNHSDIGGYTSFSAFILSCLRSEELLIRWMELNAFTPVFRTHEGNLPGESLQVYSNERLKAAFRANSEIFRSLFPYRKELVQEAAEKGWPLVRPLWLEFPGEKAAWGLDRQFLLGDRLMVAPVLDPGREEVRVFFPRGRWRRFLTGEKIDVKESRWITVEAPLGRPAAFWRD